MNCSKTLAIIVISVLFFGVTAMASSGSAILPNEKPLFQSFDVMKVKLEAPLKRLFEQKTTDVIKSKKVFVEGTLIVDGYEIPVSIRMRGFSSLMYCLFPKLMIKIKKGAAAGTPFEGITKFDVGTHCEPKKGGSDVHAPMHFNHREALLYRWLSVLGIPSLSTRPALITYVDTSSPEAPTSQIQQAFFLEHFSEIPKRAKAIEIRPVHDFLHPDDPEDENVDKKIKKAYTGLDQHVQIDRKQLAKIALFEAFISNIDWNLGPMMAWNLKLIELPSGEWMPIPLDFNLSGIAMGSKIEGLRFSHGFFESRDAATKIAMLEEFESKRREIESSLEIFADDPTSMALFSKALNVQFAGVAMEKAKLK